MKAPLIVNEKVPHREGGKAPLRMGEMAPLIVGARIFLAMLNLRGTKCVGDLRIAICHSTCASRDETWNCEGTSHVWVRGALTVGEGHLNGR